MGKKSTTRRITLSRMYQDTPWSGSQNTTRLSTGIVLENWRVGDNRPMWKKDVINGSSATNAMSAQRQTFLYTDGILESRRLDSPNAGMIAISTFCGLNVSVASFVNDVPLRADAKNQAAIRLLKKIGQENRSWNGLVFLGELREVIRMIRKPAASLQEFTHSYLNEALRKRRAIQSSRRSSSKKKADIGKMLAGSWIEYSFGAAPLINDITDIAASALRMSELPRIKRISSVGIAEKATSSTISSGVGGVGVVCYYTREDIRRARFSYIAGYEVDARANTNMLQNVYRFGGFNLREVIPTAWELLPWSFLIDYFSNIGDVLEATLVSTDSVRWVNQCDSLTCEQITHSGKFVNNAPTTWEILRQVPPSCITSTTRLERTAGAIAIPQLRFELPMRTSQFINMAALLKLVNS